VTEPHTTTEDEPVAGSVTLRNSMRVIKLMFGVFTAAMLVLIGGLYVDGRDRDDAIDAVSDALDQFEADRIDRSINACQDRNAIRIGVNQLALGGAGFDEFGNPTERFVNATPEQQARVTETFLSKLLKLQVCTDEAIERFIASNRAEGVIPIDGTDGSYSEAVTPP